MKKYIFTLLGAASMALLTVGCQKNLTIEMPGPDPLEEKVLLGEPSIVDAETGEQLFSTTYYDGTIDLNVTLPSKESTIELLPYDEETYSKVLGALKKKDPFGQYTILPEGNATLALKDGADATHKVVEATLTGIEELPYSIYNLPVLVKIDDQVVAHFIKVPLMGTFVPLSEENKKPLPTVEGYTEPIKMVAYVETNDWDPRNIGNFVLKDSKLPVFDMIVCFAANMNYDLTNQRRVLFFNSELQPIVNNPDVFIKPIRDRGIKLIMDILPNHHGVGYHNFQSYEEALDFASQLKYWSEKAGIDGWDVDEEYAEYHKLPDLKFKFESSLWFLRALRETLPNTLITHYEYNSPFRADRTDETGKTAADYIDYGWTDYGVPGPSTIGIPNNRFGNKSIQASYNQLSRGASTARSILNEKMQCLMIFNMTVTKDNCDSFAAQLSEITQVFYGEDCIYSGPHFIGPKGK